MTFAMMFAMANFRDSMGKVPIEQVSIEDPQITVKPTNPNRVKKAKK